MVNSISNLITPGSVVALSSSGDSVVERFVQSPEVKVELTTSRAQEYIKAQKGLSNSQQSSENGFFDAVARFFSQTTPTTVFF